MLFLKILLVLAILAAVLYVLGRFLHNVIYTDVPANLYWRAPAAAAGIVLAALAWPLAFNAMGSMSWPITLEEFMGVKQGPKTNEGVLIFEEVRIPVGGGQETTYVRRRTERGAFEYRDDEGRRIPPGVKELTGRTKDGETVRFRAEKDSRDRVSYIEIDGERSMSEEEFGTIRPPGTGQFFLNLIAVLVTATAWFLCLWLLLLFQWPHALGLAIPFTAAWLFLLNTVAWT